MARELGTRKGNPTISEEDKETECLAGKGSLEILRMARVDRVVMHVDVFGRASSLEKEFGDIHPL